MDIAKISLWILCIIKPDLTEFLFQVEKWCTKKKKKAKWCTKDMTKLV